MKIKINFEELKFYSTEIARVLIKGCFSLSKFFYYAFYDEFHSDNRIKLVNAYSKGFSFVEILTDSFKDKGIWNLSSNDLNDILSRNNFMGFSPDGKIFSFTVPITKHFAGKSLRMKDVDLLFEAQSSLRDFANRFLVELGFQVSLISVHKIHSHYELQVAFSENPHIVLEGEVSNYIEREKLGYFESGSYGKNGD